MKNSNCLKEPRRWLLLAAILTLSTACQAQNLDVIGVTLLRSVTTNLNGTGIRVAQPEGGDGTSTNWEVNPGAPQQPSSLFIYASSNGTTNSFPNTVGAESPHANGVAQNFYGLAYGVATNVAHVDNLEANYFINQYIEGNLAVDALVVNQSFSFGALAVTNQQAVDSAYDDYAEAFGTFFVSAANNFGPDSTNVCAPGTSYNCISVGAYANSTYYNSIGPTIDNGRCKPDITASAGATSYSTPLVSGAVAVLMQAGLRGDGGSDTNAASDMRTIKALLLNGAVKPLGWTNASSSPLDARYGAGMLNVFNSYQQLTRGKNNSSATNLISPGAQHPPVTGTNTVPSGSGWNFQSLASSATNDAVNHYFFNVSNGTVTATLVWNRQLGETDINDLDLFLFDAASSNLVACSTSRVDNVEHIFLPKLAAGRYDLQVLKNGGTNVVSDAETYALAWAFAAPALSIAKSGTNAALRWPVYPAGFRVEATTNLASPAWNTNDLSVPVITNSMNRLILIVTNAQQFFRLRQPDF
jgi:Subtilase family